MAKHPWRKTLTTTEWGALHWTTAQPRYRTRRERKAARARGQAALATSWAAVQRHERRMRSGSAQLLVPKGQRRTALSDWQNLWF